MRPSTSEYTARPNPPEEINSRQIWRAIVLSSVPVKRRIENGSDRMICARRSDMVGTSMREL